MIQEILLKGYASLSFAMEMKEAYSLKTLLCACFLHGNVDIGLL